MNVLGIELGSTRIKAVVVDGGFNVVVAGYVKKEIIYVVGGRLQEKTCVGNLHIRALVHRRPSPEKEVVVGGERVVVFA